MPELLKASDVSQGTGGQSDIILACCYDPEKLGAVSLPERLLASLYVKCLVSY